MISYRIMPVATDTLKLSTPVPPPAMGRLRTPSHRDFTSGETPLPLTARHQRDGACKVLLESGASVHVRAIDKYILRLQPADSLADVGHTRHGQPCRRARAAFEYSRCNRYAAAPRYHHAVSTAQQRRADDRAQVMGILHAVRQQQKGGSPRRAASASKSSSET